MTSGAVQLRRVVLACEGYRMAIDAVFGIGLTQSQTLSRLAVHEELSPTELGERLGLTSGSITDALDRLGALAAASGVDADPELVATGRR